MAFVQEVGGAGNAGATTIVITVGTPTGVDTTAGNFIAVRVGTGGQGVASVADSKGNTYQVDLADNISDPRAAIATAKITTKLVVGDTITVTLNASSFGAALATEHSGWDPVTWFDKSAVGRGVAGTASDSTATTTTAQADEELIGVLGHQSTITGFTPEVVSPVWTARTSFASTGTIRTLQSMDRVVAATGTYSAKATWTTARSWSQLIATYKLAANVPAVQFEPVQIATKRVGPAVLRYLFRRALRQDFSPTFDPAAGFPWTVPDIAERDQTVTWYDGLDQETIPGFVPIGLPWTVEVQVYPDQTVEWYDGIDGTLGLVPPAIPPFDPATGFPWTSDPTLPDQTVVWTDGLHSAIGLPPWDPTLGFPWTTDPTLPDITRAWYYDDTAQSWTIQPPVVAPFDPAAGFPWPGWDGSQDRILYPVYNDPTLYAGTATFEPILNPPSALGEGRPVTEYVVELFNSGATFGPNASLGEVWDARNLGWSRYDRMPGKAFWTMAQTSPLVSKIVPLTTHVRIWRITPLLTTLAWVGAVVDTDNTGDDVIVTCFDYIALLGLSRTGYKTMYPVKKLGTEILSPEWALAQGATSSPLGFVTTGTIQDPTGTDGVTVIKTNHQFGLLDQMRLQLFYDLSEMGRANTAFHTTYEITRSLTPQFQFLKDKGVNVGLGLTLGGNVSDYRHLPNWTKYRNNLATIGQTVGGGSTEVVVSDAAAAAAKGLRMDVFTIKTLLGVVGAATTADQQKAVADRMLKSALTLQPTLMLRMLRNSVDFFNGWDISDKATVEIGNGIDSINTRWRILGARATFDDAGENPAIIVAPVAT